MLTREDALRSRVFHCGPCSVTVGPRGGTKVQKEEWRENGAVRSWVTRPDEWERPVKYGLYSYAYITHRDAGSWHTEEACPLSPVLEALRDLQAQGTKVPAGRYRTLEDLREALPSLVIPVPPVEDLSGLLALPFPVQVEEDLREAFGPEDQGEGDA